MALAQPAAGPYEEVECFLDSLADPDRALLPASDVAVVVAHPDDETIGCGAQLSRLAGVSIIVATNGAPLNIAEARCHGCSSTQSYAELRSEELCRAMALARVPQRNIIELGMSDQGAVRHLADLARSIYYLLAAQEIRIVLTHAYEGGHPDHDATAFAVHAAAALRGRHRQPLWVIEMPFYRADGPHQAVQQFPARPVAPVTAIRLNDRERTLKRAMLAAYASQRQTLSSFSLEGEYFRPAAKQDFLSLPNNGTLLYERHDWGTTGEQWLALVEDAQHKLGLGELPWD
jgi:LmbE family N-acetylglucosaminyl deacetylase